MKIALTVEASAQEVADFLTRLRSVMTEKERLAVDMALGGGGSLPLSSLDLSVRSRTLIDNLGRGAWSDVPKPETVASLFLLHPRVFFAYKYGGMSCRQLARELKEKLGTLPEPWENLACQRGRKISCPP
jgi:hypothetical protein